MQTPADTNVPSLVTHTLGIKFPYLQKLAFYYDPYSLQNFQFLSYWLLSFVLGEVYCIAVQKKEDYYLLRRMPQILINRNVLADCQLVTQCNWQ